MTPKPHLFLKTMSSHREKDVNPSQVVNCVEEIEGVGTTWHLVDAYAQEEKHKCFPLISLVRISLAAFVYFNKKYLVVSTKYSTCKMLNFLPITSFSRTAITSTFNKKYNEEMI